MGRWSGKQCEDNGIVAMTETSLGRPGLQKEDPDPHRKGFLDIGIDSAEEGGVCGSFPSTERSMWKRISKTVAQ